MPKQEAVSIITIFTTVHHHAFSCLIKTEEMKMGIQTGEVGFMRKKV